MEWVTMIVTNRTINPFDESESFTLECEHCERTQSADVPQLEVDTFMYKLVGMHCQSCGINGDGYGHEDVDA